jgi:hypothetical protein
MPAIMANMDKLAAWEKEQRTEELDIVTVLVPGRWAGVDFVLPGTTSAQLGHLFVKIEADKIRFPAQ